MLIFGVKFMASSNKLFLDPRPSKTMKNDGRAGSKCIIVLLLSSILIVHGRGPYFGYMRSYPARPAGEISHKCRRR